MELAVISPPAYLPIIADMKLGYHMALGQELVRDKFYRKFYAEMVRRGEHVIVDNGAAEPAEERVPFEDIVEVFHTIGAHEIVLPDVLRDRSGTLELWILHGKIIEQIPVKSRVVIPQGRDVAEWCDCFENAIELMDFRVLGIPKHLERFPSGRVKALEYAVQGYEILPWDIHFFGIWNHPANEIHALRKCRGIVRGIDSGAPIAWAQAGDGIQVPVHQSLSWTKEADTQTIRENIALMRSWCEEV